MDDTVRQYEREVEETRARLAGHLAALRAPETVSGFTDALKQDAVEAKDAAVAHAKETASTAFHQLVETMKGKAAANPVAALTIGAGIAWKLFRDPPIAATLIGAGLFSMWRTEPFDGRSDADYVTHARGVLKQQTETAVSHVTAKAGEAMDAVAQTAREKAASAADSLKETMNRSGDALREGAADAAEAVASHLEAATDAARRGLHEGRDSLSRTAASASHALADIARSAGPSIQPEAAPWRAIEDDAGDANGGSPRDRVLLGIAGLAVAAALGFAYQRGNNEV